MVPLWVTLPLPLHVKHVFVPLPPHKLHLLVVLKFELKFELKEPDELEELDEFDELDELEELFEFVELPDEIYSADTNPW